MKTNILTLAITLTLGVILAGSLLMPVISDATTTEKTFDNTSDALFQVAQLDDTADYEFEWIYTDPTHATVNGETVTLSPATVICSTDSFLIRYGRDNASGYYLQSIGGDLAAYGSETNKTTLTIVANAGSLTATVANEGSSPSSKTISYVEGYGIVANGDYVMKSPAQAAHMLEDSKIVAMGLTSLDGVWNNMFQITGTVEEVEVEQIRPSPATYTISNVAINSDAVEGYNGLFTLDSITFTATQIADNSKVHDCTYNYFIVPASVTAELTNHLNGGEIAIMNAIPFMIIAALVVMAAGALYLKRDD